LHAWLGLTLPEYQLWVYDGDALPTILRARLSGVGLDQAVAERLAEVRVGDGDPMVVRGLQTWLGLAASAG
jgi:hypothetical protein